MCGGTVDNLIHRCRRQTAHIAESNFFQALHHGRPDKAGAQQRFTFVGSDASRSWGVKGTTAPPRRLYFCRHQYRRIHPLPFRLPRRAFFLVHRFQQWGRTHRLHLR